MGERTNGPVSAQQTGFPGVTRKVLERLPVSGDNRELVVVEVTYPPGGVAPLHRHPVGGAIYIVEGVAESAYGSDDPRQYRAGETLQDRADIPHTLFRNCDPERPLRFLHLRTRTRTFLHNGAMKSGATRETHYLAARR
jgi:quercetin dioxygenase-like cupin family protein